MTIEIVVPQVGEAVAEVILVQWFKEEGEAVRQGEPLFEVDTDKVTVEIEAFADGVLDQILVGAGVAVMPQQIVGVLRPGDTAAPPTKQAAAASPPSVPVPEKSRVSPVARRMAAELNVAPARVTGSGIGGRVTAADVRRFAAGQQAQQEMPQRVLASPKARRVARELGVDLTELTPTGVDGLIRVQDVEAGAPGGRARKAAEEIRPLSKLRRAVADSTLRSKQTVPHFYLLADVDMTQVQALRAYCRAQLGWERSPTYTDIMVRAAGLALEQVPAVNVYFTEEGMARRERIDVGVAVHVEDGLVVPVLAGVEQMSLQTVSAQVQELAHRSRSGRLRERDLGGKSIVVSNLGMHAIDAFIAIIDMPAPMILAVGRVADRCVPIDGMPAVRPICTLTLSADHRVLDGVPAAAYLSAVKTILERPFAILGGDS